MYNIVKEVTNCNLIYFIGNKIDLYEPEAVRMEEAIKFAEKENLKLFGISCLTGEGIKIFLDDLILKLIK